MRQKSLLIKGVVVPTKVGLIKVDPMTALVAADLRADLNLQDLMQMELAKGDLNFPAKNNPLGIPLVNLKDSPKETHKETPGVDQNESFPVSHQASLKEIPGVAPKESFQVNPQVRLQESLGANQKDRDSVEILISPRVSPRENGVSPLDVKVLGNRFSKARGLLANLGAEKANPTDLTQMVQKRVHLRGFLAVPN